MELRAEPGRFGASTCRGGLGMGHMHSTTSGPLPRTFSTYLDLLRASAALAVFLVHLTYAEFTGGVVTRQLQIGRPAGVVFFGLSGYVIAYVARERERTVSAFAVSRPA